MSPPVERRRPEPTSAIRPKLTRRPEPIVGGNGIPQPGDVPLLPDPTVAPERHGAVAPRRQGGTPVRRWAVRLYSDEEAQAWDQLRLQLGRELGRMPSLSEIAAAAGVLAAGDEDVRAALAERIRRAGAR